MQLIDMETEVVESVVISNMLIANRGEISIRIARAATDLGIRSVAIFTEDDADSLHTRVADVAHALPGKGARGYLDIEAVLAAAKQHGCDAIHPGYGFLSERADFARRCEEQGITFIGPRAQHLDLFGDKARARQAAVAADVPVLEGVDRSVSLEEAKEFMRGLGAGRAVIIKAIAGGGGRGTRAVTEPAELEEAFKACQREAEAAFGIGDLYVEEFLPSARHVEVQILGDLEGQVTHLSERECSIQRRNQKVIEIAPAPALDAGLRNLMIDAAMRFASHEGYSNLGTFEFLIDTSAPHGEQRFVFIEANARLQVEHTVTEEVTGVDLVQTQIRLAAGESLRALGLADPDTHQPRGFAIQARVNMETVAADGSVQPAGGRLSAYDAPSGPGVRTDGFGYAGYETAVAFDSLLAKVIASTKADDFSAAVRRLQRALSEFRIAGVANNISFIQNILAHEDFGKGNTHTRWIEANAALLAEPAQIESRHPVSTRSKGTTQPGATRQVNHDPLALFNTDGNSSLTSAGTDSAHTKLLDEYPHARRMSSPMQGTIVSIDVKVGDEVYEGQGVAVCEAMKMEHIIQAECSGRVCGVVLAAGDIVREGSPIVLIEEGEVAERAQISQDEIDLDYIRPDLAENRERHALTLDENRHEAVAKRHARGYRMPRVNVEELVDEGSFKEYWPLLIARRHHRHDLDTLREQTPADGLLAGTATINAPLFGDDAARAMIVHYDYTVLAGTQGKRNHYKQDRVFELALRYRLPLILFGEGGGGRPGDDNIGPRVPHEVVTFTLFSQLSGLVPLVAIVNGRTFAGNTALVACSDVIIATEGSTIAMGGPAMIEGGGLGVYTPEEVGPMSFQVPNGVVDILVKNEAEAVQVAQKYLSYFQGNLSQWEVNDQRNLRHIVPENRLRLYDMREVIDTLADKDSVLEIREKFGIGLITSFIRIEGRPLGVIANNPHYLSGAIDSDAADKGARFMQLCDAFDISVLSLMDCPGMMVGPDVEQTALVRRCAKMFNVGANMTAPFFSVVVRKGYGLGANAMAGSSTQVGMFNVGWPTAEFYGMNVEGSVKLGYRKELEAIEDPEERLAEFQRRVDEAYEGAKAVNAAAGGGLDDVIDPADTREWIAQSMSRLPPPAPRSEKKYPYINTW